MTDSTQTLQEKDDKANKLILTAIGTTAVAGAIDFTPGGLDVPVIITAWGAMLGGMAVIYDAEFDNNTLKRALVQAVTATSLFMIGTKTLIFLLKVTGVGYVVGGGINAALNAIFTWRVGILFQRRFRDGGVFTYNEMVDAIKGIFLLSISDVNAFLEWRNQFI